MIPFVWLNSERMSFACCNMLNEMADLYPVEHYTLRSMPEDIDGAVVVFHGGGACGQVFPKQLNALAAPWKWVIFVSVGDEAQDFDSSLLSHPNMKLWVQAPLATTKADRYLIQGYPKGTRRIEDIEKNMDWCFAGQDTHERRHACIKALQEMNRFENVLLGTSGFGKGMDQLGYLVTMTVSRIAPCPAGPSTPDTFRVYEALECGAIPILDAVSLRPETRGVWPLLLGDHPLPVVEDWSTLPEVMEPLLKDYDRISRFVGLWWKSYKMQFRNWLAEDLMALGVSCEREEKTSASAAPSA